MDGTNKRDSQTNASQKMGKDTLEEESHDHPD